MREKAKEVRSITPVIQRLLDDMLETLRHSSNGLALAAPQIGILKRLVVIDMDDQVYELVNPRITQMEGVCLDFEGCLSLPEMAGEVERAERVTVEALNRQGETFTLGADGQLARALQHEIDHLDGVLFIDKVKGKVHRYE